MDKLLEKIIDIVKLSPRYMFLPILLICGFALFAPTPLLNWLSIDWLVQENRPYIGIAFVVSLAFIMAALIGAAFDFARGKYGRVRVKTLTREARERRLHKLTEIEKDYLRPYLEEDTPTQNFDLEDGVAQGLQAQKIIYMSSPMGYLLDGFAFNIQPWARDYLKDHPELLASKDPNRKSQRPEPGARRRW
jgi:ABC-type multidrug transport system fused ATPase/permease subunit